MLEHFKPWLLVMYHHLKLLYSVANLKYLRLESPCGSVSIWFMHNGLALYFGWDIQLSPWVTLCRDTLSFKNKKKVACNFLFSTSKKKFGLNFSLWCVHVAVSGTIKKGCLVFFSSDNYIDLLQSPYFWFTEIYRWNTCTYFE